MEPRFGRDFSDVRVHTGDRASVSARALNAIALTAGRDIVFRDSQFAPDTSAGRQLLAHEPSMLRSSNMHDNTSSPRPSNLSP